MFIIKGHWMVWDAEHNAPLFTFENGIFQTKDKEIAEKAKKAGFILINEPETDEAKGKAPDSDKANAEKTKKEAGAKKGE